MANATDCADQTRQRKSRNSPESTQALGQPGTVSHASSTPPWTNGAIQPIQHDKTLKSGKGDSPEGVEAVVTAVAHATIPAWVNVGFMLVLIFGGCCANVFTLEAIVSDMPHAGALITFTQFVVTSLLTLPNVLSFSAGPGSLFLKERAVPLKKWIIFTAFFMTVNLMNNSAFLFKISVPLHIIIRSGGPVTSMIIGYLYNSKRYTQVQILAVFMLSVGVITAALADARAKGKSLDIGLSATDNEASPVRTLLGFAVLGLAMVLAAFQGVYADRVYQKYGRNNWREGLFYSHALSLLALIPTYQKFLPQIKSVLSSPAPFSNLTSSQLQPVFGTLVSIPLLRSFLSHVPLKLLYLLLNALTQYLCIRGVYLLSAKSSSLTVTVVLNIRKLVSLILSVYLFGNHLSTGVMAGAAVVFLAGGIYAWEGARLRKIQQMKAKKSE
ncbi:golgi uridine diphosphate-N- acetylglucosamine transporter [Emydomyces testavorans]|uniref:Golgi uridine diphosphate-N- acetylglucosamine transporter n=1 Tax=Emydomyces testavorans TaxID=2070801 RepID=A0AAF0DHY8_9EURO|nr:golgi uridine diphosphate-N- acetylglucosamine transporter [Emydomyces testavorans]